jgi:hypothetical protein
VLPCRMNRKRMLVPAHRGNLPPSGAELASARLSPAHSSASLCGPQRLRVIFCSSVFCAASFPIPSCNTQLQLREFLRSVDSRRLKSDLSPFRINTSKNFCAFCIAHIRNGLKLPIINTSKKNDFNSSRINTSEKQGGGGLVATGCNWGFAARPHHSPLDKRSIGPLEPRCAGRSDMLRRQPQGEDA